MQRLAVHLSREFPAIWSFLFDPTIHATNWRVEQALRPAVVTRKVWVGNRWWSGADAQQTMASVIPTAPQRHLSPHALLASMLQSPAPLVPLELPSPAVN
jgi:transposase